jgi:hypothetical protein
MNKELQEFLFKHIRQMLFVYRLTHFDVTLNLTRSPFMMDIIVDYVYINAELRIGKSIHKAWKKGNKEKILQCLAHELTHIATGIATHKAKNRSKFLEHEEAATELISRVFYRLYVHETKGVL